MYLVIIQNDPFMGYFHTEGQLVVSSTFEFCSNIIFGKSAIFRPFFFYILVTCSILTVHRLTVWCLGLKTLDLSQWSHSNPPFYEDLVIKSVLLLTLLLIMMEYFEFSSGEEFKVV